MSLVNVPCAGPPRCWGTGAGLGLCIAARSLAYAEGRSEGGGPPWAGRPALAPCTATVPPDLTLLGAVLVMARGPGGLA